LKFDKQFSHRPSDRNWIFLSGLLFLLTLTGCKWLGRTPGFSPATIHAITREFAVTARQTAPAGTVIRMKLQAKQADGSVPDRLEVTIFEEGSPNLKRAEIEKIARALAETAKRHKLATAERSGNAGAGLLSFKAGLRTTHVIEIRLAGKPQSANLSDSSPKLAIILDDLGSDRAAAEAIFRMPYPLTISVLPNHEHSTEIAEEALERGYQVMLHLPMESVAKETPEHVELRPGMSEAEVGRIFEQMVESVPNAVGVNNHQGSEATSDSALMDELMRAIHGSGLFYVDSRTTAATVAFDSAQRNGVPSAYRNVPFLDDVQDVAAIRKQLEAALRGAKEKKTAIAIGHPHQATLAALREFLPRARASGVRLVFASELVR
jgi:polysaccharide deacetylase 2 family uncharacterized protein YibQ